MESDIYNLISQIILVGSLVGVTLAYLVAFFGKE
jgi:hypothetical protein